MKRKEYYGFFSTGSTYNREPITENNLAKLKKTMRSIAYGNNTGNGCRWWIQDELSARGAEYPIAEGYDK
jgi:hypothetical protein